MEKQSAFTFRNVDPIIKGPQKSTIRTTPKKPPSSEIREQEESLREREKRNKEDKSDIDKAKKELLRKKVLAHIPVTVVLKNLAQFLIEQNKKYRDEICFKEWKNEDPYKYLPITRSSSNESSPNEN